MFQVELAHVLRDGLAGLVLPQEMVDRVQGLGVAGGDDEVADRARGLHLLLVVDAPQAVRQVGEPAEPPFGIYGIIAFTYGTRFSMVCTRSIFYKGHRVLKTRPVP